jgi:hypothetical protein
MIWRLEIGISRGNNCIGLGVGGMILAAHWIDVTRPGILSVSLRIYIEPGIYYNASMKITSLPVTITEK